MSFPKDLKPISELGADKPHGTRLRYMSGCKCMLCRAANSNYEAARKEARQRGEWNGLVSAENARRHIEKLSKRNIGYKTVADVAGIAHSTIFKIKSGERKNLRARNEQRILDVDPDAIADGAPVDAAPVWRKINWLLREGFTKTALAKRLGYKNQLQIGRKTCLASTALKVEKFYNTIRAGDEEENYEDDLNHFLDKTTEKKRR